MTTIIIPRLETMEDRVVPTVLFAPQFGVESLLNDGGKRIASPSVYVVLWGSSWGGTATPAASNIDRATSGVVLSNYLDGLAQYGMSTKAIIKGFIFDNTPDPASGFAEQSLVDEINRLVANNTLPDPTKTPNMIIDMVTAPGIASDIAGAGGYNNSITFSDNSLKYGYIWNGTSSGALSLKDATSLIFSHEMAEIMTDPGGLGYNVKPGATWTGAITGTPQIGDYEGNSYQYRLGTGLLVQPYWSAADKKYIITDGNTQRINITPNWNKSNNFVNYSVTINGGQKPSAFGDTLFTNSQSSGDQPSVLAIVLNNELFQIDNFGTGSGRPGTLTANIPKGLVRISAPDMDGITINAAAATEVDLNSNSRMRTTVAINNAGVVSIGPSARSSVSRTVIINSPKVKTTLVMDDRTDEELELFRIKKFGIESLGYTVSFSASQIRQVSLLAGSGRTEVIIGSLLDALEVLPLNINVVGNNTDTSLQINGIASLARNYAVDNTSVVASVLRRRNSIVNRILFQKLTSLEVDTGSLGNHVNVNGSPAAPTKINTGIGNDFVTVNGSTGPLSIDGMDGADSILIGGVGSTRKIFSSVSIDNPLGFDAVTIDDTADRIARTGIVYKNVDDTIVNGLTASGDLILKSARLSSLTIRGGTGGNAFRVHDTPVSDTPGGLLTSIFTGSGPDQILVDGTRGALTVDVQGAPQGTNLITIGSSVSGLDPLNGPISVTGRAFPVAASSLSILDGASTTSQSYELDRTSVQRLGTPKIEYHNMLYFNLYAGSGNDNIRILDTMPRVSTVGFTAVNTTSGNDQVKIVRTTGTLLLTATNSSSVAFGDATHLMDAIDGAVGVIPSGAGNAVSMSFNDLGSKTPRTLDIAPAALGTSFQRTGSANISVLTNPLSEFNWFGGSGRNMVNIKSLPAAIGNFNLGPSGDSVNIGSTANRLFGMGNIKVLGGAGLDQLNLRDQGTVQQQRYDVDHGSTFDGIAYSAVSSGSLSDPASSLKVQFAGIDKVALTGGLGNDSFGIHSSISDALLSISGGGGFNSLDYSSYNNSSIYGLVSWYPGEGNTSDVIGVNNGIRMGPLSYAPGIVGQAFNISGEGTDYVRVPNSPVLETAQVSVEAWVKSAGVGLYSYVISKGSNNSAAASYALYSGASGGLVFYIYDGINGIASPDAGVGIWDNQWHHVVGTFDQSKVRLYVDGVQQGDGTATNSQIHYGLASSNDLLIGNYVAGDVRHPFQGLIDEPSIYNRALAGSEISSIFQAGASGKPSLALEGGVMVNLKSGTATGLEGGIRNIQNVTGSAGDDILLGVGSNVLNGGSGRDLLIAQGLAMTLNGGSGDDILIAGTTSFDNDPVKLSAILAQWTSANGYSTRVTNLQGGLNGSPLLNATTVRSNRSINSLNGGIDQDFFFANPQIDQLIRDPITEVLVSI